MGGGLGGMSWSGLRVRGDRGYWLQCGFDPDGVWLQGGEVWVLLREGLLWLGVG